jgi:hypothetical protein
MSKETEEKKGSKEAKPKSRFSFIPETLRDKRFFGGICITGLATYIFSPLAMAGGAFVGGMMGVKAAAKYDNPNTPKMNLMRKAFGAFGGAAIGALIVFGCAFVGSLIAGPVGAVLGAAVGAAITYKASSSVVSKYAAPSQSSLSTRPQDLQKEKREEPSKGKDKAAELADPHKEEEAHKEANAAVQKARERASETPLSGRSSSTSHKGADSPRR